MAFLQCYFGIVCVYVWKGVNVFVILIKAFELLSSDEVCADNDQLWHFYATDEAWNCKSRRSAEYAVSVPLESIKSARDAVTFR